MEGLNTVQQISILILPVLFAITVHEAAHGWMAKRLGDSTAQMLGRVTLNPMRHIDLVGTIIVPFVSFLFAGFLFGWAKPVPVNWRNLGNPRRDMALVALAGPGANLLMALVWAVAIKIGILLGEGGAWVGRPLVYMGSAGVLINAILMVLNLLPILPLDGGRCVAAMLPPRFGRVFARMEPYGLFIVLGLLATGLLGKILWPAVQAVQDIMQAAVGL